MGSKPREFQPPSYPTGGLRAWVVSLRGKTKTRRGKKSPNLLPRFLMPDCFELDVIALVDTCYEVNLIRRNLIPEKYLLPPREKVLLKAANQTGLGAGHREVRSNLIVEGFDMESKGNTSVTLKIDAYDADIDVDVLPSYGWLATLDIDIRKERQ